MEDWLGNAEADTAADLGGRHQLELVMDDRRALLNARAHWYPIIQQLHRFMIAVSRVAVNHDGVVLPLIRLDGIVVVSASSVRLTSGLMLILLLCLGHLGSFLGLGFRFKVVYANLLHFGVLCTGLLARRICGTLWVFLFLRS